MSLAQKMKLQDLKAKIEEFSAPRRELLNKQINDAATTIQKDVLEFFKSKGFAITGQVPKLKATYNGGLDTFIDFSKITGSFFGCDGGVEFKYENKEFTLNYSIKRGKSPERNSWAGRPEEMLLKEIEFYEKELLPYLESTGVSDLSGEVVLFSMVKNTTGKPTTQKYESVEQALNSLMD
ncbi:hypothetical protein ACLH2J_12250 [Klebsiella michiganensis]|uniref:hypothetical protein n=1 Tax=Klebsiella/Raoultella group TaxID=2890311 RepID=UPI00177EAA8D|nr:MULTISPECIES: hypothetical protein [Klebsiella/Raoultella group]MBD9978003.1 hypothetical protein [Citrobacter braakii]HBZ8006146.1 hypothetical protein [Klebsiella variicola subsp. variicola]WPJ11597.1 hypothetical protein SH585_22165 [Raoultella ornithinolytica]HDU5834284.1 hypothetical protein [Klebsiella quasipneumoniae subsp. similipneumoniae]HEC2617658.1 hypothetical protein [Raoultella ornithinolytica]